MTALETAAEVMRETNCRAFGVSVGVTKDLYWLTDEDARHMHHLAIAETDKTRLAAHVRGFVENVRRAQ